MFEKMNFIGINVRYLGHKIDLQWGNTASFLFFSVGAGIAYSYFKFKEKNSNNQSQDTVQTPSTETPKKIDIV